MKYVTIFGYSDTATAINSGDAAIKNSNTGHLVSTRDGVDATPTINGNSAIAIHCMHRMAARRPRGIPSRALISQPVPTVGRLFALRYRGWKLSSHGRSIG